MAKLIIIQVVQFVALTIFITVVVHPRWAWAQVLDQPGPSWAKTLGSYSEERTTVLQFYFHDVVSGKFHTAVQVVPAPKPSHPFIGFGFIAMVDDPLTVGPDPNSNLVGRAQGMYCSASHEDMGLIMSLTCTFSDGIYNGSSVSILAQNDIMHPMREFPVVGGTGLFCMARGYVFARTYSFNLTSGDAIVGYNITLLHH